jgi:hypothetical protein
MSRGLIAGAAAAIMLILAGGIVWNANASPMTAPSLPNYTPIEKVGCSGPGRCGWGRHWVCGPYGRCGCVACGVGPHVYVAPHVYHPYVYHPYAYPRARVRVY